MRTAMAFTLAGLAMSVPVTSGHARGNNGPEFTSMGQCKSYLRRWTVASERGESWQQLARFEAAYCVETEWGTIIAVFPL